MKKQYSLNEFYKVLKPFNINQKKKRIGPNEDGGYVCSEFVLEHCSSLITYGVGDDYRFEREFSEVYKKPVYLFDHTIDLKEEIEKDGLRFIPEGLGTDDNCKCFFEHAKKFNFRENLLLKIDIEGAEWDFFKTVDVEKIFDIAIGIIVEIHWIDCLKNRKQLVEIFNRLSDYFVLHHTHGNSWGATFTYDGMLIPSVLELSFVNKKFIQTLELDKTEYPIKGLDYSNDPSVDDIKLNFLKNI